jgi:hypothetical protein
MQSLVAKLAWIHNAHAHLPAKTRTHLLPLPPDHIPSIRNPLAGLMWLFSVTDGMNGRGRGGVANQMTQKNPGKDHSDFGCRNSVISFSFPRYGVLETFAKLFLFIVYLIYTRRKILFIYRKA